MIRLFLFAVLLLPAALEAQGNFAVERVNPNCLPNANSIVREFSTVFHITDDDEAEVETKFVVTILNAKGKSYQTWVEQESQFVRVKQMQAVLYDAQGKEIASSGKKDVVQVGNFSENEYANVHLLGLSMEAPQFPYTVAFSIRKKIDGFFRIEDFIVRRLDQSVEQATFTLQYPETYGFSWKGIHTDVQPVVTRNGKESVSVWSFQNLPALPDEPHNPFPDDVYAKLVIAPKKVKIEGKTGDFSNWKSIGAFLYDLNKNRDALPPATVQKVQSMTAGKSTREKIDLLYRYMQAQTRYVSIQIGLGGWQTIDATTVDQKNYGDCKALSNYMKALLKAAGVESQLVAIYGSDERCPELYDDAPIPSFNHMILYVPDEDIWLECTSKDNPPGYLGTFTAGHPGLRLGPEGGKLLRTPELSPAMNQEWTHAIIRLDEQGNADIQGKAKSTGSLHEAYRILIAQKKQPEIEKTFAEELGLSISRIQKLNIAASSNAAESTVDFAFQSRGLGVRSGKRLFVPLHKTNPFKRKLPSNDQRVLDVYYPLAYTQTDTIELVYPAGFAPENIPKDQHLQSEFGSYDLTITGSAEGLKAVYVIRLMPVSVPASRYQELRQFYLDVAKADGAQLVLLKKE